MKEIKIIVGYSEEDEGYIAKIEGKFMSAYGESASEAVKELLFVLSDLSASEIEGILC